MRKHIFTTCFFYLHYAVCCPHPWCYIHDATAVVHSGLLLYIFPSTGVDSFSSRFHASSEYHSINYLPLIQLSMFSLKSAVAMYWTHKILGQTIWFNQRFYRLGHVSLKTVRSAIPWWEPERKSSEISWIWQKMRTTFRTM